LTGESSFFLKFESVKPRLPAAARPDDALAHSEQKCGRGAVPDPAQAQTVRALIPKNAGAGFVDDARASVHGLVIRHCARNP